MNNKIMNSIHNRNNQLARNGFSKLIALLSLDGEKKFVSGMLVTAWNSYVEGNLTGQYRRLGDRCEWIHPHGMAPYKKLCLDVVPNTEIFSAPGCGTPGGSAQIAQWIRGGVVNLSGPVGFGIGNYTTTNHTTLNSVGTGTLTINTVGSTYTIALPNDVIIKTP